MTEKRFTLEEFGDRCVAHDNGMPMNARQVVEFLNAYEDENEQLKQELHKIKVVNEMLSMDFANSEHELYKENEQLKYQNEILSDELEQCKAVVDKKWSEYLKKKGLL